MNKKFLTICILFVLFVGTSLSSALAVSEDFSIDNSTEVRYSKGEDFVTVHTQYLRKVLNKSYYYPATGEKVFHVPDLPQSMEHEIELERQFKKDSLVVRDNLHRDIKYSIEDLKAGEGFYVKVPNYKQTTTTSPYNIYIEYKTHDLIRNVNDWIVLQAPSLPSDITLTQTDKVSGTNTSFSYDLKVVVDKDMPILSKVFPSKYSVQSKDEKTTYSFNTNDRIDQAVYLEFGTSQVYKFELKYQTPKTDTLIPEKYSSVLKVLSTNIYELSLPREYSETNQIVKISDIYPTPKKIVKDSEGNIIATFEIEANKESEISVEGYIWVEQSSLEDKKSIPNPLLSDYKNSIAQTEYSSTYLSSSSYWEVDDEFIQSEGKRLVGDSKYLMDVIRSDYSYVNERLEYDESKVTEGNNRIGAKAALQGGGSVCMEYADSMIALLRAQGIAARAALGYANLETLTNTEENSVRHQWVQVWIPDYGWLSIDPTFESKNMKIGQEINRVLWETFNEDSLSNIRIYSADNLEDADSTDYSVRIYAVDSSSVPNPDTLQNYSDIQPIQEASSTDALDTMNMFVKTTTLGKATVIVAPILAVFTLIVLILLLITTLLRRTKTQKV